MKEDCFEVKVKGLGVSTDSSYNYNCEEIT